MSDFIGLIRHGQASFFKQDYDQLSDLGHKQARITADIIDVDIVIRGTMKRHAESAAPFEKRGVSIIENSDWNEFDYHDVLKAYDPIFTDMSEARVEIAKTENPIKEFQRRYLEAVARWASGKHDADYNESRRDFIARVKRGWAQALAIDTPRIAIVTSAGTIAVILEEFGGFAPPEFGRFERKIVNSSITKFIRKKDLAQLFTMNEHAHLLEKGENYVTFR